MRALGSVAIGAPSLPTNEFLAPSSPAALAEDDEDTSISSTSPLESGFSTNWLPLRGGEGSSEVEYSTNSTGATTVSRAVDIVAR